MKCTPPPLLTATSFLLLTVLWLCGCRAINPVVQSDYNRAANFDHYRTFAWHQPDAAATTTGAASPTYSTLVDQRIRASVESELLKRGLTPATTSAPDLLLAYDISVNTETELTDDYAFAPGFGFGYSYWYGYRYSYNHEGVPAFRNVQDYQVGTVIIDFIDPSSNELVWRGWGESRLNVSTLEESKISKIVARIIAQYPPGGSIQQNIYHQGR